MREPTAEDIAAVKRLLGRAPILGHCSKCDRNVVITRSRETAHNGQPITFGYCKTCGEAVVITAEDIAAATLLLGYRQVMKLGASYQ